MSDNSVFTVVSLISLNSPIYIKGFFLYCFRNTLFSNLHSDRYFELINVWLITSASDIWTCVFPNIDLNKTYVFQINIRIFLPIDLHFQSISFSRNAIISE